MQAWVHRSSGQPSKVLKLEQNYPKPTPSGDKILVKVHAASLNPVGWKTMGEAPLKWLAKKPAVPESDVSGVIEGGDLSDTDFKIGNAVFGIVPAPNIMKTGQGVLAEYTLVEKHLLVRKPSNISFEEAASFPLTTFTAYSCLVHTGGLKKGGGQRVFINGGSGGVGVYAIQLAKAYGAYVVATCSPQSKKLVESVGADELIDYKEGNLVAQLSERYAEKEKPFDIVFDTIGKSRELYNTSASYLTREGVFVDINGPDPKAGIFQAVSDIAQRLLLPSVLGGVPRKYKIVWMHPENKDLKEMAQFIEQGKLKPVVDEVFPFEQALKAYDRQIGGRSKGKVIVSVV